MLINGHEGVLSIGGTAAQAIDMVVSQTEQELDNLGALERGEKLANSSIEQLFKRSRHMQDGGRGDMDWETGWTWNKVQGAEGWW